MARPKIDLDPTGPITFKRQIDIPTPSGKALQITWELKHRLREEMATLTNGYARRAQDAREAAEANKTEGPFQVVSEEEAKRQAIEVTNSDVEAILDVAVGWDVDGYAFSRENLFKLCRMYPAAAVEVLKHYSKSMLEGRLGN